jgi:hypothetical protein
MARGGNARSSPQSAQEEHPNNEQRRRELFAVGQKINAWRLLGLETLADAIGSTLYLCAKARLLLPNSHDYFERLFQIYKNQAFPCGWRGGQKWETADFLIFSR